jgi:hypothetical protein
LLRHGGETLLSILCLILLFLNWVRVLPLHVFHPACVLSSMCSIQHVFYPACVPSSMCSIQHVFYPACVPSSMCSNQPSVQTLFKIFKIVLAFALVCQVGGDCTFVTIVLAPLHQVNRIKHRRSIWNPFKYVFFLTQFWLYPRPRYCLSKPDSALIPLWFCALSWSSPALWCVCVCLSLRGKHMVDVRLKYV